MLNEAYLCDIEYYLPDNILSNDQINIEHPEWSADKISLKTGIRERHIAGADEFSSDLGYKAAIKLFSKNFNLKDTIDYLIFCTQSPDYYLPTTACVLQQRLELGNNVGAIDINMGCSGFIYGLSYAKGLIGTSQAENVLLITAETYSKYINSLDKSNKTIFGDGASAAIISKNNIGISGAIKKFSFYTDGFGYDKLIVKNGGLRNKNGRGLDVFDEDGNFIYNDSNLFMDGKAIFDFTAFNVPRIVDSIIIKNDLTIGDIDLFIFHQANIFMIDFIRKRCKIPEEKFFIFVENCANTVSSTIPIAIKEAIGQNRIQRGSKVLLIGFGVGLSIAGTIVDY